LIVSRYVARKLPRRFYLYFPAFPPRNAWYPGCSDHQRFPTSLAGRQHGVQCRVLPHAANDHRLGARAGDAGILV